MGIYELGEYIEVHPTFLYESIATFILFIVLMIIRKRKFTGQLTYIYFMWYGIVRLFIEGLRTDSLMLGPIRISQAISAIILILGLTLYLKNIKRKNGA